MALETENDARLVRWIYGVLDGVPKPSGDFLLTFCQAVARADDSNYQILRPSLMILSEKYPEYDYAGHTPHSPRAA